MEDNIEVQVDEKTINNHKENNINEQNNNNIS